METKNRKMSLCSIEQNTTKEMLSKVKGGAGNCGCGCVYAGQGGSSTCDNSAANYNASKWTPGGHAVLTCGNASLGEQQFWGGC